jgi:excisionase family DNA binding protein
VSLRTTLDRNGQDCPMTADGPRPRTPPPGVSPWFLGLIALGALFLLASAYGDDISLVLAGWLATVVIVGWLIYGRRMRRWLPPDAPTPNTIISQGVQPEPPDDISTRRPSKSIAYPAVMTLDEAADFLRVDAPDVIAEIRSGRMPGNQIGDQWRIRTDALYAWLDGPYGAAQKITPRRRSRVRET